MLDLAGQKGIYSRLDHVMLGGNDYYNDLPHTLKNKFDVVVSGDLINTQHFDENVFESLLLALKNGGFMIFSAQYSYLGDFDYCKKVQ